jgi:hypothetical protein
VRLTSEVLPVVSVDALSFVVFVVEWAPLSLKVELVELTVTRHFVYQWCPNVLIIVCE